MSGTWTREPTLGLDEIVTLGDGAAVDVRLTRLYEPEPRVIYRGPARLVLEWHGDRVVTIGVREPDWADHGPGDWAGTGLVAENYLLEVFSGTPHRHDWYETTVGCEDCGDHPALACDDCDLVVDTTTESDPVTRRH